MSKKTWFLIILVICVSTYLLASKLYPDWAGGVDNTVVATLTGTVAGVTSLVTESVIWQTWGYWLSFGIGLSIMGVIAYTWHQGYNRVTNWVVGRRLSETGFQNAPMVSTATIIPEKTSEVIKEAPKPVPTAKPEPAPKPTEKTVEVKEPAT